jgi:hypothetical protein
MFRIIVKIIGLTALVVAGSVGIYVYYGQSPAEKQIKQLEQEKKQLEQIVQRLTDERRIAEMLVTDQQTIDGVLHTTVLFVEYAKDGTTLPPKSFTLVGDTVHIDAMVIKFDGKYVEQNDPLRGHSIALFTKIYGSEQTPAQGFVIDEPGRIPDIYRGIDPKVSQFEQTLWKDFWRLAEDPAYRQSMGVRVADGQGSWGPLERDKLYTLSIESDGGINKTSEPLRGIYREALKMRAGAS